QNGLELFVDQGSSWQWFLNDSPIPGATDNSFTVSAEGDYTVLIGFENGCAWETAPYGIVLSAEDYLAEQFVSVAPNPSNGVFELQLNMPEEVIQSIIAYEIITPDGRIVDKRNDFKAETASMFNLSDYRAGMYYLKLINDKHHSLLIKIIIR
ncbi:MAG TPA: T9SS type A sorting domain-containing protein, partial [Bacteroidales bacterium]|nr:T9SS type A sorting domain-containing protein [Bacteroidales bacterium]